MKKTQQKRRGGKQQKRKGGKTQKRRGDTKRKVMSGGDRIRQSERSERSKSYRSSRPVFQAVKNQKIREILPSIPERYRAINNKITYQLPGTFKSNTHTLNTEEQDMYNEFLASASRGETITNDSINDWVTFVNNWRQGIDANAESNAHNLIIKENVNSPN